MNNFIFHIPTRILFGAGQLTHLHDEKLPGKKALIITSNGQSVKKHGYLARLEKELARSKQMLSNEKFLSKAPQAKIEEEKKKLAGYEDMMAEVVKRLEQMQP